MILSVCLNAQKMNGICLVGSFEDTDGTNPILNIKKINANWLAILPEAKLDRVSLKIESNNQDSNWTQPLEEYLKLIRESKKNGLKVLLKPHIVIKKNISANDKIKKSTSWRGEIAPKQKQDWETIENNYSEYILALAHIAETENVDAFCIGTELKSFITERPAYWQNLISELRQIYTGPITYSANWDNYQNIPFWSALDYIGMNCYFPINKDSVPSIHKTKKNWKGIKEKMEKLSIATGKKILITEYGYRNVAYSGVAPWTHDTGNAIPKDKTQTNLLQSLLQSLWTEDWIIGGFLWNWNYKSLPEGNTDFSIQNKPAESLIKQWYSTYQ